jgi:hypothetical protein
MTEATGWLTIAKFVDGMGGDSAYLCNILRYRIHNQSEAMQLPDDVRFAMLDRLSDNIKEENVGTFMPFDSNPWSWFAATDYPTGKDHNQSRVLYCLFMAEQLKGG